MTVNRSVSPRGDLEQHFGGNVNPALPVLEHVQVVNETLFRQLSERGLQFGQRQPRQIDDLNLARVLVERRFGFGFPKRVELRLARDHIEVLRLRMKIECQLQRGAPGPS